MYGSVDPRFPRYKKNYTIKFLVGITASGAIVFVSEAYPGKITDFAITESCKVLELIEVGDYILADRGFNIQSLLTKLEAGVLVGHTHLVGEKSEKSGKYTTDQLLQMARLSNVRIHVERAMMLIKRMGFLGRVIRHTDKHVISAVIGLSAMLTNYGVPLLNREDAERVIIVDEEE